MLLRSITAGESAGTRGVTPVSGAAAADPLVYQFSSGKRKAVGVEHRREREWDLEQATAFPAKSPLSHRIIEAIRIPAMGLAWGTETPGLLFTCK